MKKHFIAICSILVLIATSLSPAMSVDHAVYAATAKESIQTELSETTEYFKSALSEKTTFGVRDYEDILLVLKAKGDISSTLTKSLTYIKGYMSADGVLSNGSSDEGTVYYHSAEFYAILLLILDEADVDSYIIDSEKLVDTFESVFTAYDVASGTINLYYYRYIAAAIDAYADSLSDSSALMNKVKDIILSFYKNGDSGVGIDSWGISADNNGAVLPALYYLYDTDADIKAKVDAAITWTIAQLNSDGTAVDSYSSTANTDSTGLVLHLLSTYESSSADLVYSGLLTFKDAEVSGGYTSAYDKHYATRDAYYGLISYSNMQNDAGFFLDSVDETAGDSDPNGTGASNTGDTSNIFYIVLLFSAVVVYSLLRNGNQHEQTYI